MLRTETTSPTPDQFLDQLRNGSTQAAAAAQYIASEMTFTEFKGQPLTITEHVTPEGGHRRPKVGSITLRSSDPANKYVSCSVSYDTVSGPDTFDACVTRASFNELIRRGFGTLETSDGWQIVVGEKSRTAHETKVASAARATASHPLDQAIDKLLDLAADPDRQRETTIKVDGVPTIKVEYLAQESRFQFTLLPLGASTEPVVMKSEVERGLLGGCLDVLLEIRKSQRITLQESINPVMIERRVLQDLLRPDVTCKTPQDFEVPLKILVDATRRNVMLEQRCSRHAFAQCENRLRSYFNAANLELSRLEASGRSFPDRRAALFARVSYMSGEALPNSDKAILRAFSIAVQKDTLATYALARITKSFEFAGVAPRGTTVADLVQPCLAQLVASSKQIDVSTLISALQAKGLTLKASVSSSIDWDSFWAETPPASHVPEQPVKVESFNDTLSKALTGLLGESSYARSSTQREGVNFTEYTVGDVTIGVSDPIQDGKPSRAYVTRSGNNTSDLRASDTKALLNEICEQAQSAFRSKVFTEVLSELNSKLPPGESPFTLTRESGNGWVLRKPCNGFELAIGYSLVENEDRSRTIQKVDLWADAPRGSAAEAAFRRTFNLIMSGRFDLRDLKAQLMDKVPRLLAAVSKVHPNAADSSPAQVEAPAAPAIDPVMSFQNRLAEIIIENRLDPRPLKSKILVHIDRYQSVATDEVLQKLPESGVVTKAMEQLFEESIRCTPKVAQLVPHKNTWLPLNDAWAHADWILIVFNKTPVSFVPESIKERLIASYDVTKKLLADLGDSLASKPEESFTTDDAELVRQCRRNLQLFTDITDKILKRKSDA